jgi:hypothetical protein
VQKSIKAITRKCGSFNFGDAGPFIAFAPMIALHFAEKNKNIHGYS